MLTKPANHMLSARIVRKFNDYLEDERGSIAIFMVIAFVMILMLGGIAVDVMRFETRRVALQETLDRAVLASANLVLDESIKPKQVIDDWFAKAGLGNELTVDYSAPVSGGTAADSKREGYARATVRSYNHFMQLLDYPYFQGQAVSVAQQGVSKIEVILALDITGSMADPSGSTTKIDALEDAATKFVQVLKFNKNPATGEYDVDTKDPDDLISIGMVPYSSNVNIPANLRDQFNVTHLSSWDLVPNKGVPDLNCMEIPESTFDKTALSTDDPIPMAAAARVGWNDPGVTVTSVTENTTGGRIQLSKASAPTPTNYTASNMCHQSNILGANLVRLPSTDTVGIIDQIEDLEPKGTTSIAVGMRWATALIDESAKDIYSALITEPKMAGRPAANNAVDTRKIIVLMTDGDHVASRHIKDEFKSGPSPIWRGMTDGNLAIRFDDSGVGITGGTRPGIAPTGNPRNSCSGWSLANTVVNGQTIRRNFFVPHLKENRVAQRTGTEAEGAGNGELIRGACDPRAWLAPGNGGAPSWSGSGAVQQLDWSEVWRYASVDWVIRNLFIRSNVTGATDYNTLHAMMVGDYLTGETNMDALLAQNCTAAKTAGIEIYGIVLGDAVKEAPVKNCASTGNGYYHKVTNADNLVSTFEQIAILISELKLTQ